MDSKKAWKISCPDIVDEPWHYDDIIVYAETRGKAKAYAWKNNSGWLRDAQVPDDKFIPWRDRTHYSDRRNIEYTDLRVNRVKKLDKIEYNGKIVTKFEASSLEWCEKRDAYAKYLAEEFPDKTVVVWNGSYNSYWGGNRCGYSSNIINAGLYSTKEGYDIVRGSDYSRQEEVRLMSKEDINAEIDKMINVLQKEIDDLDKKKR